MQKLGEPVMKTSIFSCSINLAAVTLELILGKSAIGAMHGGRGASRPASQRLGRIPRRSLASSAENPVAGFSARLRTHLRTGEGAGGARGIRLACGRILRRDRRRRLEARCHKATATIDALGGPHPTCGLRPAAISAVLVGHLPPYSSGCWLAVSVSYVPRSLRRWRLSCTPL